MDDQTQTNNWDEASDDDIFDADLLIALGLETLPDEEKVAIVDKMTTTVQKAVVGRLYDQLSEEQRTQMEQILENPQPEALNEFLSTNVPNFPDLVKEETIKFKRAMLTGKLPE